MVRASFEITAKVSRPRPPNIRLWVDANRNYASDEADEFVDLSQDGNKYVWSGSIEVEGEDLHLLMIVLGWIAPLNTEFTIIAKRDGEEVWKRKIAPTTHRVDDVVLNVVEE